MNDESVVSNSITETMELVNRNKQELELFLSKYQLPGRVDRSEKRVLVSSPRRIPIVTERFTENDGFYFNEPTIGDLMAMINEMDKITGKEDLTLSVALLSEYIVRHNSNVQLDSRSRSSDYDEIRSFVMRSLQQHFLSLLTYKDVVKEMEEQDSIGSTELSGS